MATTLVATVSPSSAATAVPTSSAGANKITDLLGDPVIAKGKGVEVKRSQLDAEMLNVQAMARAQQQQIPPDQMMLVERQKLNDLIGFQLLLGKATEADRTKVAIRLREGRNTHHVVEACFKGVARCLRDAVRIEGGGVPSTKGAL